MNKEDILMLVDYFAKKKQNTVELFDEKMNKLIEKLGLIKKQIEAQDIIQDVQKELAEMDKIKEDK